MALGYLLVSLWYLAGALLPHYQVTQTFKQVKFSILVVSEGFVVGYHDSLGGFIHYESFQMHRTPPRLYANIAK